jgi:anti-sigma B factor antagonist
VAIRYDEYNRVGVLSVDGDLSGDDASRLRQMLEELTRQRRVGQFVVDFEKCEFIDSAGLETLSWARRHTEASGGQIKLACLDENCRKILEITRLGPRFECHPDLAAAVKHAA